MVHSQPATPSQREPVCPAQEIPSDERRLQVGAVSEDKLLQKKTRLERHRVEVELVVPSVRHLVEVGSILVQIQETEAWH